MERRWGRRIAALAAVAVLAAACGGDGDGGGGGSAADGSSPPAEEGDPKPGGSLLISVSSDIDSIDPTQLSSYNTHQRVGLVYNRLLRHATGPDVEYQDKILEPELAEEWEVADDGLTYTFHLRDDVTWHDVPPVSGRPFTSDDVVATLEHIRAEGFQRYMLENVTAIEAPDEHTVVLRLSEPFAPLLNFMANHHMWMLPREGTDGRIDLTQTAVGTGPFVMTKRERNVETAYARNPNYFKEGLPYLDEVRMLVIPDQAAKIASFRSGDIDYSETGLSPEDLQTLRRTNPDARYIQVVGSGMHQLFMNPGREPWDDIRVRRAASLAIDREGLGASIFGGGSLTGPVPPALGEFVLPDDEIAEAYRYDPDEARRLLAEAGFPNGFETGLMLTTGYGEQVVRMAEWVVEDLAQVGIRANLELLEYATYFGSRWPSVDYDMGIGPQTPFMEPDEWLRAQYRTDASRNWFGVSDPELDEMLDEQTRILDEEDRKELVLDIQRYILDEVLEPAQLWSPQATTPLQAWVKGWHPIASYGYPWLEEVWLDE